MSDQHRAPLAAFALVTMIAGGVVVQSLAGDDPRPDVDETVAVTTVAPTSRPSTNGSAAPTPTGVPTSVRTSAPTMPGSSTAAAPADRPGDVRPVLPVEVFGAIPGLAAFLTGDSAPSPSFQPEQPSPGIDLGSTSGPSPSPGPTTPPSEQPAPSGQPSPGASPSGSPSPTATSGAERPVEPSSTPTSTAPTP